MTVKQQQCLLEYLGYSPGPIDGVAGARTRASMAAFTRDYGLDADGLPDAVAGRAEKITAPAAFWDGLRWFTREEFRCKCGGRYCGGFPAEMRREAVEIAEAAREHFGRPAHVISGLRCPEWNAHEGGVWNSQHMYGEAIDLCIDGVGAEDLQAFVRTQPNHRYSYCINGSNVHFDIPAGDRA